MHKNDEKSLIVRKASELSIAYPKSECLEDEESSKIRKAVTNGGIVHPEKGLFESKPSIQVLLQTDKKGANKVYNDAPDDDKITYGGQNYLSVPEVKKQLEKRLGEPRGALEQEELEYAGKCLDAFRDSEPLKTERHVEADRIKRDRPKLTAAKIRANGNDKCELSGESTNGKGQGHHIERVADNPRKARDLNNIVIVKEEIHDKIHKAGAETPEKLKEFIKENGYQMPKQLEDGDY